MVFLATPGMASAISLQDVLRSSRQHYPKIIEAREKIDAQKGKIQEATGAFDWNLDQENRSRASGYYDGLSSESQISRRLSQAGARIYTGYRFSDGSFPIYEQQYATRDSGEINIGAMVSLWRDRIIDQERFLLEDARLEMGQKEVELLLTQMTVQFDAMTHFINCIAAGMMVTIAEEQLELAEARQNGLEMRLKKGDVAKIYLTENKQAILKRQSELVKARQYFNDATFKLSLYYRNEQGDPIVVSKDSIPSIMPPPDTLSLSSLDQEIERARSLRPEMIDVSIQQQRNENELKLSENSLKPRVDLIVEGARDLGSGDVELGGTDTKIGLNISIPLQQNIGEGKVRQRQAEARQIEQRKRLLNDRIATEIQSVANAYHTASENLGITQEEMKAASDMHKAERIRFEQGAADFFLLNLREERMAEARLRNVKAQEDLWNAIAAYYIATLQSEKLGL
jgi:outer membrane protein TolC